MCEISKNIIAITLCIRAAKGFHHPEGTAEAMLKAVEGKTSAAEKLDAMERVLMEAERA
jgi:hypothetical protein